jgi:hypothetical protein
MIYKMIVHPVFWFFLAGLFLGAAAALLILPNRRRGSYEFKKGRPAKIYLFLTGAVVCATIALFVSSDRVLPRFPLALLAGFILTAAGLRFKKAAGIPLLVLATTAAVFGVKALSGWDVAESTPAGTFIVLNLNDPRTAAGDTALSFTLAGKAEVITRGLSGSLKLKTEFIVFPAGYLIFSALPLYRIRAVSAADGENEFAVSPSSWEKFLLNLPGVHIETNETELPFLSLFAVYSITVYPEDAAVEISEQIKK